jgi:ferritin-like metal-binding protein YciE
MAKAKAKRTTTAKKSTSRPAAKKAERKPTAQKTNGKTKENLNGSLLEDFFVDALKDIYWAEKALTKALPKMSKSATSKELKKALDQHLEVTKKQIDRLEEVFEQMGKKAQGKKCDAMEGLVKESESIISETKEDTSTRDAALIIAAQKVEHYEIASYGGLVQLAKTMKKNGIAKVLQTTLDEEKEADVLLTKVAEKSINEDAAVEPGEGEAEKTTLKETIMTIFS